MYCDFLQLYKMSARLLSCICDFKSDRQDTFFISMLIINPSCKCRHGNYCWQMIAINAGSNARFNWNNLFNMNYSITVTRLIRKEKTLLAFYFIFSGRPIECSIVEDYHAVGALRQPLQRQHAVVGLHHHVRHTNSTNITGCLLKQCDISPTAPTAAVVSWINVKAHQQHR